MSADQRVAEKSDRKGETNGIVRRAEELHLGRGLASRIRMRMLLVCRVRDDVDVLDLAESDVRVGEGAGDVKGALTG